MPSARALPNSARLMIPLLSVSMRPNTPEAGVEAPGEPTPGQPVGAAGAGVGATVGAGVGATIGAGVGAGVAGDGGATPPLDPGVNESSSIAMSPRKLAHFFTMIPTI